MRVSLERSRYFKEFTESQREMIIGKMNIVTYDPGKIVIKKGTRQDIGFWVVLKGELQLSESHKEVLVYQCIGDELVLSSTEEVYSEDYLASAKTDLAFFSREEIEKAFGIPLFKIAAFNKTIAILRSVPLLKSLTEHKIVELGKVLEKRYYQAGEKIVRENEIGDAFYILEHGEVEISKEGAIIATEKDHDYFGEVSLMFDEKRNATVTAHTDTQCLVLSKSEFLRLIDTYLHSQLIKRIHLQDDQVDLADLNFVEFLNKGVFYTTIVTSLPDCTHFYALKTVSMTLLEKYPGLMSPEDKFLKQLEHPFIIKVVKTFRDPKRLYSLTEYVQGQNLRLILEYFPLFSDEDSRFYISCLFLALECLHRNNILYRDLKPEKIHIDDEGYPKLINFRAAKISHGKTYTVIGTPLYMAPEIIRGNGYNAAIDYWSLGIVLFELLYGFTPFESDEDDPYAIYEKILKQNIKLPESTKISQETTRMLETLLNFDPLKRSTYSLIKEAPYFTRVNWESLLEKQGSPPLLPETDLIQQPRTQMPIYEVLDEHEALEP